MIHPELLLCYELQGGGTLDISILHVSEGYCDVIGSDGDDRLGGADFDATVAQLLTQQHSSVLENLASYDSVIHDNVDHENNVAEVLVSSCDRITDDLPLCSVSSFHTLGEKIKVDLSQQQQPQRRPRQQYKGTLDCLIQLYNDTGIQSLFTGMRAKLLQTVLTAAFTFLSYEQIVRVIQRVWMIRQQPQQRQRVKI